MQDAVVNITHLPSSAGIEFLDHGQGEYIIGMRDNSGSFGHQRLRNHPCPFYDKIVGILVVFALFKMYIVILSFLGPSILKVRELIPHRGKALPEVVAWFLSKG